MNRFGKTLAALLLLAIIAFAAAVRWAPAAFRQASVPLPARPVDSGGLVVPVFGVARTTLVDSFTDGRSGNTRAHGAIDIMAPRGTPVVAAAAGRIEKLFDSAAGGHTIYVRSVDGGTVYYYAHLDTYLPDLREGLNVVPGQAMAAVGSTGDASPDGPHLHFEVKRMAPGETWYQGVAIDPYPLLAGKPPSR